MLKCICIVLISFVQLSDSEFSNIFVDDESLTNTFLSPLDRVDEAWFSNKVDHFGVSDDTYQQRFFVNTEYWQGDTSPIFFYCGNEADVSKYVEATGLMWENAASFKAALIFAEHRYYGKSLIDDDLQYLSHDQALADYAALILSFKSNHSVSNSPVIAFGGSYGGMLAAWFRYSYPDVIRGSIASSAPVLAFPGSGNSFYADGGNSYWQVITNHAGPACADRSRKGFQYLLKKATLEELRDKFTLCQKPKSNMDVALWIVNAFDLMAMGNFPFPSNYLTEDPSVFIPANPLSLACDFQDTPGGSDLDPLSHAVRVYANASQKEECFKVPKTVELNRDRFSGLLWTYQWCSEVLPEEFYFTMTGTTDMFFEYNQPMSFDAIAKRCAEIFPGMVTNTNKIHDMYGGKETFLSRIENVVFANGLLDPWSSGSILHTTQDMQERGVYVLNITLGAHHLDLMFAHPGDPEEVKVVRKRQVEMIRLWVNSATKSIPRD